MSTKKDLLATLRLVGNKEVADMIKRYGTIVCIRCKNREFNSLTKKCRSGLEWVFDKPIGLTCPKIRPICHGFVYDEHLGY